VKINSSQLGLSSSLLGKPVAQPNFTFAHPMEILLFGQTPPRRVDKRKHPKLAKAFLKLEQIADQVAELVGRNADHFPILPCEGYNACISALGQISFGIELLEQYEKDHDLLIGVLGHEIGHRPWTWQRINLQGLSRTALQKLRREEESKADSFAGWVLAELGGDPASLCRFLMECAAFEPHPTSDYHPAEVRAELIRSTFQARANALGVGKALAGAQPMRRRYLR
jgi:hypothetical protein